MHNTQKRHWLRNLFFAALLLPTVSLANEEENEGDFQWFSALSLVGGYVEGRSFLNGVGDDPYEDFLDLNWELHLEYKGFFYEQPGLAQERIDGQFSGHAGGYRYYIDDSWNLDFLITAATDELQSTFVSPEDRIVESRRRDRRAGFRLTGVLDNYFVQAMWTPHSLRSNIGGNELSLSVRRDWQIKNLNFYASVGARYRSSEIMQYYYGISDDLSQDLIELVQPEINPDIDAEILAPSQVGGGAIISTRVGFEYPLSENWVMGGVATYQRFPSAMSDSIFIGFDDSQSVFALSLTYVF